MQYCVDHPEEVSKLAKVKAQVSEVKEVMMENIEKVCLLYDANMYSIGVNGLSPNLSVENCYI